MKVQIPNERETRIMKENGLDPKEYGVTYQGEKRICLLCYKTRDEIEIRKGDRKW